MTMMLRALFPLLLLWTAALQAAPAFPPLSGRVVGLIWLGGGL